ncbi:hypothetical protein SKTS_10370 [Sulfurimicrobium lacus]|uniref:Uncharacterized protein n=1 Tax=Sulfurimicrobium lacus TaxID=2715678 RepID=A0A6F8VAI2_9PROT|nr:hypothetical protein [Sulfurimicrobium lacus]BCB26151.1 hypothetical protein SKTS_10370 [Sulfurimicrobium lacus]
MHIKIILRVITPALALLLATGSVSAQQSLQDRLVQRAIEATKCEETPNNGRYCTYKFGKALQIGIKDVGGSDTTVGFHNSNINSELYAVLYFGCVAVVPGHAHPKNYDRDYGVFISPRTGNIYRTSPDCQASLK